MNRKRQREDSLTDVGPHRRGGQHGNIDISGNARVQLGDSYYIGGNALKYVEGATYDAKGQVSRGCHPETRKDLLQNVKTWAQKSNGERIFWLQGQAGTGKSTISYTVSEQLDQHSWQGVHLGASFFFKRGERGRASTNLFLPTIIRQLTRTIPALKPYVDDSFNADPDICSKSLSEQFNKLFLKPFQKLDTLDLRHFYIVVIDALDECDEEEDTLILLQLLRGLGQLQHGSLKFFLTSRPEFYVRLGFAQMPSNMHEDLMLHELPPTIVLSDISTFIRDELASLRDQHNQFFPLSKPLAASWPGDGILETLSNMANPLFILAATLCRFLADPKFNPQQRLDQILQSKYSRFSNLGRMYYPILAQMTNSVEDLYDREMICEHFKLIVGSIVNMEEALSMKQLALLLDIEVTAIDVSLRPLHSVLWVSSNDMMPIRPLHLSFSEYVCGEDLNDVSFRVERAKAHETLFRKCLRLLEEPAGLRENICGLPYPGFLRSDINVSTIENNISPALQYACKYWIHHAVHSQMNLSNDEEVHKFFRHYFLHWLEALSLMDVLSDAIPQLQKLKLIVNVSTCPAVSRRKIRVLKQRAGYKQQHSNS